MLKITYTNTGFYLEYLQESLETWLLARVLLCLRASTSIYVEPSTASVLIPGDLPYIKKIAALQDENGGVVELTPCDEESVEFRLRGTWITTKENSESGIFVSNLSDHAEISIYQLWQSANLGSSLIGE